MDRMDCRMSTKSVKIGIWTTCIISCLLLLLYLPVLIWSPPWGNDGYYIPDPEKDQYIYHLKQTTLFFIVQDPYGLELKINLTQKEQYLVNVNHENGLLSSVIVDGVFHNTHSLNSIDESTIWLRKSNNPFAIWRLKWLEWTK